jgi:S1-C subfamily serine protease
MSDRPEDYTDVEQDEPPASEPAAPPPAASPAGFGIPWWQQPHGQPSEPSEPSQPSHGPQPLPPPPAGEPTWGYGAGPYGPYGGPSTYGGRSTPGGPSTPGGWHGGHWAGGPWTWSQPGGWGVPVAPPQAGGHGRRKLLGSVIAVGLTALALLVGIGIGYGVWNSRGSTPSAGRFLSPGGTSRSTSTTTSQTGTSATGKISSATGAPANISTIASEVTPGLVDINTVLGYETDQAAGTGMVLTPTGKVLTNNHVIEGSTKITATDLGNGKVYQASVIGYTRTQDVAVIQLKGASGLKTVHVGNSSAVKVGQAVVGIGNAGGTGGRPSAAGGSVTALGQAITASDQGSLGSTTEHLTGLIESNANIQPGDSGGPLVTTAGAVVGMDTAASAAQGYSLRGATGQGYSIPINEAISLAHQIIAGKSTASLHIGQTPFLGVYVVAVTTRTQFGGFGTTLTSTRTSRTTSSRGAVVAHVIPGTPAQTSGLVAGDVITNVGGTAVTSPSGLTQIMLRYHPGDSVKVVWTTHSGQTQSASIGLANGPAD